MEPDLDWALLVRMPWREVWFDIEAGIKVFVLATDIARCLDLVDRLRAQGIALTGEDGRGLRWVTPPWFDDSVASVGAALEAAGLVQGFNEIVWELPPDRR